MAKPEQGAAAAAPEPTEPLADFCAHVSTIDRRVELISGFFADETRAGHAHATRAEWEARFAAFRQRPVT